MFYGAEEDDIAVVKVDCGGTGETLDSVWGVLWKLVLHIHRCTSVEREREERVACTPVDIASCCLVTCHGVVCFSDPSCCWVAL